MSKTHYANTHGLVNSDNKSSSIDLALLCQYVMNNEEFTKICRTKVFESTIKYKEVKIKNSSQQISRLDGQFEKKSEENISSRRYQEQNESEALPLRVEK